MKLYVAGKWEDRENVRKLMDELEIQGHEIVHDWTAIEVSNDDIEALTEHSVYDTEGVRNCELLVALVDKDYAYAGTLGEIGMAVIQNKEICVIGNGCIKFIFFYHPSVKKFSKEEELLDYMRGKLNGRTVL